MIRKPVEPHLFIIFGATGDLMHRKILPSLFHLRHRGLLQNTCHVLGVSRSADKNDEAFRQASRDALKGRINQDPTAEEWVQQNFFYQPIGEGKQEDYERLRKRIEELENTLGLPGNRIFYLALPPGAFPPTIDGMGKAGLNAGKGWTRLVVEKPFGRDLESARGLNKIIHQYFDESQVFRIDHYLGKETVQNLLAFRFGNALFEPLWNRDRIQRVQIVVSEQLGVEHRAGYYDKAGALRDMIQNHLTQLLTLTAMESPAAFEADAIRSEKVKVLRSIPPINVEDVLWGQYRGGVVEEQKVPGYLEEPGIPPTSGTETLVAMKLVVDNWRWQGVPFYLVTGKRLPRRVTQIIVTFRRPPISIFHSFDRCEVHSNVLLITIQPDEGFNLFFEVKAPGQDITLQTQNMRFRYAEAFGPLPEGYETLLLDIMENDQTLFVRADEVEASWKLYEPLLQARKTIAPYSAGTWGPERAQAFFDGVSNAWNHR